MLDILNWSVEHPFATVLWCIMLLLFLGVVKDILVAINGKEDIHKKED